MARRLIPLLPIPAQTLSVSLGTQSVRLDVYQKRYGLYVDVYVSGVLAIGGVAARNLTKLIRSRYLDFVGDMVFYDTFGKTDPEYTGLGSRYVLLYSPDA